MGEGLGKESARGLARADKLMGLALIAVDSVLGGAPTEGRALADGKTTPQFQYPPDNENISMLMLILRTRIPIDRSNRPNLA